MGTKPNRLTARADASCFVDVHTLPPTVGVETAARLLGIGRALAYRLVRQNEFPCRIVRAGHRYLVPTTDLLRTLGIDEQTGQPSDTRPTTSMSGDVQPAGSRLRTVASRTR
jgi:excisionase family DNA binding protein